MSKHSMPPPSLAALSQALLRSPLHGLDLPQRAATPGATHGVVASELPNLGYLVLRGGPGDAAFHAAVAAVLQVALPQQPRTWSVGSGGSAVALWLAPDEWLLVCRRIGRDALLQALEQALAGLFAQVVDNSGGLTALRLAGPAHLRLLHHLGPYDFARLDVGACVGTVMSGVSVTVMRTDAAGVLLLCRRSFAEHLWRLVERNARPYTLCISTPQHNADPVLAPLLDAT